MQPACNRSSSTAATLVRRVYRLEEIATCFMCVFLNTMILLFADFDRAAPLFILNLALVLIIFAVVWVERIWNRPAIVFLRDWYSLPLLITIYLELGRLVPLVNPHDADTLLIGLDRVLFFGHNPTILIESITLPPITEFLQIVYASFYLLPFSLCVIAYRKGRMDVFHTIASTIIIGFYISYIGYFLTPAIGPRYTLAHLHTIELTGLWSFDCIRSMLDSTSGVMRDCCPSGHTMLSTVTVLLAWRRERRCMPFATVWAAFIIFSAVYLRYHYITDILAGFVCALAFSLVFPLIEKYHPSRSAS